MDWIFYSHSQRRFVMISFKPSTALALALASAGTLLHANGVLAADLVRDPQTQARDLLSGNIGERSKNTQISPVVSVDNAHAFNVEPQEQARQLILGKPSGDRVPGPIIGTDAKKTSVRGVRRAEADPQGAARRMLLGVGA
jgi:hypothetical protein